MPTSRVLVPALFALASVAAAADLPENLSSSANGNLPPGYLPTSPGGSETSPGSRLGINGSRTVMVRGLVDLDALSQNNYNDGNDDLSDHRGYGLIRAELGIKVKMDEKVSAAITVAFYDEAGKTTGEIDPSRTTKGGTVMDDAYIEMKEFLGFEQLGVLAGRQPFAWNLREQHGAFLYDSRANDPAVTSWDGVRLGYAGLLAPGIDVAGYAYRQPDDATLFGAAIDWKPGGAGDNRWFFTGSANLERNVTLRTLPKNGDGTFQTGDELITYYAGGEVDFSTLDLFGEFAMQQGDQGNGTTFGGWGASGGGNLHFQLPQELILGVQYDYLTGDQDQTDKKNNAFINNWEAVSDTLIVEHEKYGELSRYAQGNLEALKLKAGIAFDESNSFRVNGIYGFYRMNESLGSGTSFGQEADLILTWQYTYNATFNLFGAGFMPGDGFKDVAPGQPASTDLIYLVGLNLGVVF